MISMRYFRYSCVSCIKIIHMLACLQVHWTDCLPHDNSIQHSYGTHVLKQQTCSNCNLQLRRSLFHLTGRESGLCGSTYYVDFDIRRKYQRRLFQREDPVLLSNNSAQWVWHEWSKECTEFRVRSVDHPACTQRVDKREASNARLFPLKGFVR